MSHDIIKPPIFDVQQGFEEKCQIYLELYPWVREYPEIENFLKTRFSSEFSQYVRLSGKKTSSYLLALENLDCTMDSTDIGVLNAIIITLRMSSFGMANSYPLSAPRMYNGELYRLIKWRIEQLSHQGSIGMIHKVATEASVIIGN